MPLRFFSVLPPTLTPGRFSSKCSLNVASHSETRPMLQIVFNNLVKLRSAFLLAHIPLYLYPFLHTVSKTRYNIVSNFILSSRWCSSWSPTISVCEQWACHDDSRPFEYLRLTSLGVIGALVKTDEQEVSLERYSICCFFVASTPLVPL